MIPDPRLKKAERQTARMLSLTLRKKTPWPHARQPALHTYSVKKSAGAVCSGAANFHNKTKGLFNIPRGS